MNRERKRGTSVGASDDDDQEEEQFFDAEEYETGETKKDAEPRAVLDDNGQSQKPAETPREPNAEETDVEELRFQVKNLDTGQVARLDDMEQVFPEVAKAMSLATFEAQRRPSQGEEAKEVRVDERESQRGKKALGFILDKLDRMKRALTKAKRKKGEDGASSNANGKAPNAVRVKTKKKDSAELNDLRLIQHIVHHTGPVWTVVFNHDGTYMATGGQDSIVRVWAIQGAAVNNNGNGNGFTSGSGSGAARPPTPSAPPSASNVAPAAPAAAVPAPSTPASVAAVAASPLSSFTSSSEASQPATTPPSDDKKSSDEFRTLDIPQELGGRLIVSAQPVRMYSGHKADVIGLAWSQANFLLSASIDKTVRLWHVSRQKCLSLFQHADFVTAVAFHPIEDRYFMSGSFDKKLRLWNIPEHRVVAWSQAQNIITSAIFSPNGTMVVAGLYNGLCVFYHAEGLKYFTQVECRNRHGKYRKGKKITGLQFSPDEKKLLVTSNDSRIRLYDMDDYSLAAKYKGLTNDDLQIRAFFSEDGKRIICGSENEYVYVWNTSDSDTAALNVVPPTPTSTLSLSTPSHSSTVPSTPSAASTASISNPLSFGTSSKKLKEARVDAYEYFKACKAGDQQMVTSAQFFPSTSVRASCADPQDIDRINAIIVTAGFNGELKFFESRSVAHSAPEPPGGPAVGPPIIVPVTATPHIIVTPPTPASSMPRR